MRGLRKLFLLAAIAAPVAPAPAQADAAPDDVLHGRTPFFGWKTRFHRDQLIVTEPYPVPGGELVVFERASRQGPWIPVQTESAPDASGLFGTLLEVGPDTLAVGAPSGPIHVYGRGSDGLWVLEDTPVPASGALEHGAAVGAGLLVTSHGSASFQQQIETFERGPSGWVAVDAFAWGIDPEVVEVRVAANRLLTRGGRMAGRTTVRTHVRAGSGWHLEAEIEHPDGGSWGEGLSALGGTTLVLQDNLPAGESRCFVFEYADGAGWQFEAELQPDPDEAFTSLNFDMQLSEDRVLLQESVTVAVYDRANGLWTKVATLNPPAGILFLLPTSFASNGRTTVVGGGDFIFAGTPGVASLYDDLGASAR